MLVGKTVLQVRDNQRENIIQGFQGGEVRAVRGFLETQELDNPEALVFHLLEYFGQFQYIRIAEVKFNGARCVYRLAYIAE